MQWYSTEEVWSKLAPSRKLEESQTNYGPSSLEPCLKSKLFPALVGAAQEKDEWERVDDGYSLHCTCKRVQITIPWAYRSEARFSMPYYIKPHYENDCLHWFINVCTRLWTCKVVSISTGISMVSQLWHAHECCNKRKYTLITTIIVHERWCLAYCLSTSFLTIETKSEIDIISGYCYPEQFISSKRQNVCDHQ